MVESEKASKVASQRARRGSAAGQIDGAGPGWPEGRREEGRRRRGRRRCRQSQSPADDKDTDGRRAGSWRSPRCKEEAAGDLGEGDGEDAQQTGRDLRGFWRHILFFTVEGF